MDNPIIPPKKLEGKIAIITGGASGIGESTARLFAQHGAKVVIADIHEENGRSVAESIGTACNFIKCDVADEQQVQLLCQRSGISSVCEARGEGNGGRWCERKIICTGSHVATNGSSLHIDYAMSKHALLGLVKSASMGLGQHGIRVNCVSPGIVATPLFEKSLRMNAEESEKMFESFSVLKNNGPQKAHNIADAVLFLASDDSQFVTGHNLVVDGGFYPPAV